MMENRQGQDRPKNYLTNNFDRIGDWAKFSAYMVQDYFGPVIRKYGTQGKFNDLMHYTGLRVIVWNLLKYSLRLWNGSGKGKDFEKIAHYTQMGWTLKNLLGKEAPFFPPHDPEGEFFIIRPGGEVIGQTNPPPSIAHLVPESLSEEYMDREEVYREIHNAGMLTDVQDYEVLSQWLAEKINTAYLAGQSKQVQRVMHNMMDDLEAKDFVEKPSGERFEKEEEKPFTPEWYSFEEVHQKMVAERVFHCADTEVAAWVQQHLNLAYQKGKSKRTPLPKKKPWQKNCEKAVISILDKLTSMKRELVFYLSAVEKRLSSIDLYQKGLDATTHDGAEHMSDLSKTRQIIETKIKVVDQWAKLTYFHQFRKVIDQTTNNELKKSFERFKEAFDGSWTSK